MRASSFYHFQEIQFRVVLAAVNGVVQRGCDREVGQNRGENSASRQGMFRAIVPLHVDLLLIVLCASKFRHCRCGDGFRSRGNDGESWRKVSRNLQPHEDSSVAVILSQSAVHLVVAELVS